MNRGGNRGGGSGSGSRNENSSGNKGLMGTIHADLFTRPANFDKRGSTGDTAECMANFVPLMTNEQFTIFQYHTIFEPDVDSKAIRQQILSQETIISEIGDKFIFDGMILYLTAEWSREQILEARHPITGEAVSVRFKNSVRFGHNDAQAINCYNIVLRRCLDQIGFKQMGRNYFNPQFGTRIEQYGLEVWPGFETAIRVYEGGLMLCVENRFKVLRTDSLLKIMEDEHRRSGNNVERMQNKFMEMFQGTSIVTHYNNKLHRCTRVNWDMTPESEFGKADGTMISLAQYYKDQYNLEITNIDQPIIVSEGKPKQPGEPPQQSYLIPEFCQPTGLTDDMRKDFRLMRALSQHTRLDPNMRYQSTGQFVHAINSNETCRNLLGAWQLQLGDNLVQLKSRVFPGERLLGKNPAGFVGVKAEWARECKRHGNFLSKDMQNWILVSPSNPTNVTAAQKLALKFQELGRTLSMTIGNPMCATVAGTTVQDYIAAIKNALETVKGHEVHMIVILLADDNKTRYDSLKKMLCTVNNGGQPVPSQCVLLKTLIGSGSSGGENKNFDSIVLKILLQINCKMGGALWKVNLPLKNSMLVGYDLYNDSTMRGKTIGACVSTYNSDFTQFYSQTRAHDNPTELGNNLTHFIRKALRKYYTANNETLPERVFLYRDGAGDGQIPYIRNQEVQLVRDAFNEVIRKSGKTFPEIKLSFTIVTKKVNMRVFKRSSDKLENPTPGTVVDDVVTRPERYDFYLVPQFVNQGTVTPVCYNVIYDDTGLTPDQQQKMAFKLCHLYYNWQGTVRVPSLCQYSHKLAFLVAQSIHSEVDESLRDKLFYL